MNGAVFFTSLIMGLVLQPLFIPRLKRSRIMDVPNDRSSHVEITPRGGGIAVVIALGAGLLVSREGGGEVAIVFLGALILGVVGLTDDYRGLGARMRFWIVLVVGALAGLLLNSPLQPIFAVPVMAVWVAAFVNAFNFMDGINGISGLTGLVAGVAYSLIGWEYDSDAAVVIGAALAGASMSFLPFNLPRAQVFLGDVGSYSLGLALAALGWMTWSSGAPAVLALAPLGVYLADTGTTLVRRFRRGAPMTEAHREHIYQQFLTRGHSHTHVAFTVAAVEALLIASVWWAISAQYVLAGIAATMVILAAYIAAPMALIRDEVRA